MGPSSQNEYLHLQACRLIPQQLDYLRIYFPEVDVSEQIIRDEVKHDKFAIQSSHNHENKTLGAIYCNEGQANFLCFPLGQSPRDIANGELRYALSKWV